jgi:hypothetical protein
VVGDVYAVALAEFFVGRTKINLRDAGFLDVAVTVEPRKGWIVAVSVSGPSGNAKECAKRDTA